MSKISLNKKQMDIWLSIVDKARNTHMDGKQSMVIEPSQIKAFNEIISLIHEAVLFEIQLGEYK